MLKKSSRDNYRTFCDEKIQTQELQPLQAKTQIHQEDPEGEINQEALG